MVMRWPNFNHESASLSFVEKKPWKNNSSIFAHIQHKCESFYWKIIAIHFLKKGTKGFNNKTKN
jgi:hypothetical protein